MAIDRLQLPKGRSDTKITHKLNYSWIIGIQIKALNMPNSTRKDMHFLSLSSQIRIVKD